MKAILLRQGDVALVPVSAIPQGAKDITPNNDVVLKYGEVTGHAHRIQIDKPGKLRVWDANAERYLQVLEVVSLTHEEHSELVIVPGLYHVPDQVEWTDDDEPRIVED